MFAFSKRSGQHREPVTHSTVSTMNRARDPRGTRLGLKAVPRAVMAEDCLPWSEASPGKHPTALRCPQGNYVQWYGTPCWIDKSFSRTPYTSEQFPSSCCLLRTTGNASCSVSACPTDRVCVDRTYVRQYKPAISFAVSHYALLRKISPTHHS
jgi:hypothetical protein